MSFLEHAMVELVRKKPFYASMLMQMKHVYTDSLPAVAGVGYQNGVVLYINPERFKSKTIEGQYGILEHEIDHILFEHFARFKYIEGKISDVSEHNKLHELWNFAADYAINEYIPHLPESSLWVKDLKEHCLQYNVDVEHNETAEYYYRILKKLESEGKMPKGLETLDFHGFWEQMDDATKEIFSERVKDMTKIAQKAGNVPAHLQLAIDSLLNVPKDWTKDLRKFEARTRESSNTYTVRKRNRRYGLMHPGKISEAKLHLTALVDSSGSMTDEILVQISAELIALCKKGAVIRVVVFDGEVQQDFTLEDRPIINEFKGRGGTVFASAFNYIDNSPTDGIIMFSDMDDFKQAFRKPRCPVLWACTENTRPPYDWGYTTDVRINK